MMAIGFIGGESVYKTSFQKVEFKTHLPLMLLFLRSRSLMLEDFCPISTLFKWLKMINVKFMRIREGACSITHS